MSRATKEREKITYMLHLESDGSRMAIFQDCVVNGRAKFTKQIFIEQLDKMRERDIIITSAIQRELLLLIRKIEEKIEKGADKNEM